MKLSGNSLTGKVLKACGIFGGTQSVGILCSIVRSKLVALWLGPAGFGLFAIFNSALDLISQLSSMGLRSSAVRDVAANADSESHLQRVIVAVNRWGWALGLIGSFATMALSPLLSRWTFGSGDYTWAYLLLSAAVLFNALTGVNLAILQGLSRLKRLAKASMWGSIAGLAVSVPMFYYLRLDSVLPSIIVYSAVALLFAFAYRERSERVAPRQTAGETWTIGRQFITLGFFITLSDVLNQASVYVFLAWLNNHAGEEVVGYYQAGNTLFNRYVGMIFTAISMEYYPRLASVARQPRRESVFASHEIKVALMVLVPVIALFAAAAPLIVNILYMPDFQVIVPFVTIAIVGTTLRAVSWCLAMVILCRGDGRIFLLTEGSSAVVFVLLNVAGYSLWGLMGLGVSYVCWYVIYLATVAVVYRRRYGLWLGRGVTALTVTAVLVTGVAAIGTLLWGWWVGVTVVALSALSFMLLKRVFNNNC